MNQRPKTPIGHTVPMGEFQDLVEQHENLKALLAEQTHPAFRGVEWSQGGPAVLLSGRDGRSHAIFISVHAEPDDSLPGIVEDLLSFLNGRVVERTPSA